MSGEKSTEEKPLRDRIIDLWGSQNPRNKEIMLAYIQCRAALSGIDNRQIWEVMELLQKYMKERDGG